MPTLTELADELDSARKSAKAIYDEFPDLGDAPDDKRTALKGHLARINELHPQVEDLQSLESGRKSAADSVPAGRRITEAAGPTMAEDPWDAFGRELAANERYQDLVRNKRQLSGSKVTMPIATLPVAGVKALLTLTTLNNTPTRRPGIIPMPQDETTVADLVLQGTTDNNTLTYMEETTYTSGAATVAEGAAKPESDLAFTERTDNVRKIATYLQATDELLSDVSGFRSYIEQRLRFMVEREEEDQILNGDGTPPNISGILDRSGIQTVTSANDIDAIYRAITEVRVDGLAEPTAVVIHPLSWQNIVLTKDGNDRYLGNGPWADQGERIWGLPVRVTPMIAEGTALVGAFRPHAQVFRREGITVVASTEHASFFLENKVAILAESRLALAVYRPSAFCKVTGLASS